MLTLSPMSGDNSKLSEEFDNSIEVGEIPALISRNVSASMLKNSDLRWFDARVKSGPSPSDFGEHEPIPDEAVCIAGACVAEDKPVEDKENSER